MTASKTPKKTPSRPRPQKNDWAAAFKAIGLKAVASGQLLTFGLLCIAGIIAYRIDSDAWVKIVSMLLNSPSLNAFGWVLWLISSAALTWLIGQQRKMYQAELQRVCDERNHWQINGGAQNIQPSGYEVQE